jgi:hypothetical protein
LGTKTPWYFGVLAHATKNIEPRSNTKNFWKNWARLIRKIHEVDLLVCPKCNGPMPIIGLPRAKVLLHHHKRV